MAQWVKNLPVRQETQEMWVRSLGKDFPWSREWLLTPVFLPEKSRGQRILEGHEELYMTEQLST